MSLSEADTRAKLIDPALHERGWTENLIRREETAGTVYVVNDRPRRRAKGKVDYTLRLQIQPDSQLVAVALIEAKAERYAPTHGLQQAKLYASSDRLNVPFVYSSNGHQFVEFDASTGLTSEPNPIRMFPTQAELRLRYEEFKGFKLDSKAAQPLLQPYFGGETQRRYYQDAAIRAVLEKVAAGGNRALLSMATGSGKTFIAVNLLKKIADAGQLRRALFVCDRDELRTQALTALQGTFGSDAAAATTGNPEKNARVIVATYQTLGVDSVYGDASFLKRHYPPNYFSHIVIDEAHRSAWGQWSEVLTRNPAAVQIGLTATPRQFEYREADRGMLNHAALQDQQITSDNIDYFGEPVYTYSIGQGIEDGYLAAMQIHKRDIFLNQYRESEQVTGVSQEDLRDKPLQDALTGESVDIVEARDQYDASSLEASLLIPKRVEAMCRDLFQHLVDSGRPEQKTIVFCARDTHADRVANELNNCYARWCQERGQTPAPDYAFKCTAADGKDYLAELRGSAAHHFIAATVELLTTGVDVPRVNNIVFFKYVNSPIAFYQMVGRGTRLHPPTRKLMFRVYDYTNATRLFSEDFKSTFAPKSNREVGPQPDPGDAERIIVVQGFDVRVSNAGDYILTINDSGESVPMTLEQYRQRLAATLVDDIPALDGFREAWIDPPRRAELMQRLPDEGRSPLIVRQLTDMDSYDLYDVLADLGYGQAPRTRVGRAQAFEYKNRGWLACLPQSAARAILAIASQFERGGTDNLESPHIFATPDLKSAGGLNALRSYAEPAETLSETKRRMFAA